jgi:hypothetical protein
MNTLSLGEHPCTGVVVAVAGQALVQPRNLCSAGMSKGVMTEGFSLTVTAVRDMVNNYA